MLSRAAHVYAYSWTHSFDASKETIKMLEVFLIKNGRAMTLELKMYRLRNFFTKLFS